MTTLTTAQKRETERANALLTARDSGAAAVAAEVERRTGRRPSDSDPYPEAFGVATTQIGYLLDVIDALTGGES